ncbi:MAG: hypothetical protein AMK71_03250 [Nitrospira bacterium SG8_35_4]|nr:MAG: hypothetical protein AMK71_03250 [Nitrospira bacterium SG8_35_4]
MIDWFTVSAQIINFLILVFLLKRFLYGPIIRAMDKREEAIAGRLNEAGQKREQAQKEIERYIEKNEDLDSQRADMLAAAKEAAEQQKKELIDMARKEIDDIKARWREAVSQEKEAFLGNLRNRMAHELYALARKVCSDLADMSLEEHMTAMFLKKMSALEQEELDTIKTKLKDSGEGITVSTSFALPEQKLEAISQTVRRITGLDVPPKFVQSKDILCGIELRAHGYTLGWNLDAYLTSLEKEFGKVIGS